MWKILALLLSASVLTGCADFLPPKHDAMLDSRRICCSSISALPFRDIVKGQAIRTAVGPDSPSFTFAQGKSFFLALRLNRNSNISTFIVRTYPQNMLYNPVGHVFVPRVTFLASDFVTISSVSPDFVTQGPKYGIGESAWRADLTVPAQAHYAVIHTSTVERNKTMRMRDSDQRGGYLYTNTGPAGEIEVELQ